MVDARQIESSPQGYGPRGPIVAWLAARVPSAPARFASEIIEQQAVFLHRTLAVSGIGTCLAGLFVVYVLWPDLPHRLLLGWMGLVATLTLGRLLGHRVVAPERFATDPGRVRAWIRQVQGGALLSGVLWGGIAVTTLVRTGPVLCATMLLATVLLGVASCFSYSARISVFLLFFLPIALPEVPALISRGDIVDQGFSGGLLVFIVVMVVASIRFNRLFQQYLTLGLKNQWLAAELRRQRDEAQSAAQAKSRALASTGHDLRQPVHAIELSITTLRRMIAPESPLRMLAEHLEDGIASLWQMLDSLAETSRLDANLVPVRWQICDLNAELMHAVAVMAPLAAARNLRLRYVPTSLKVCADVQILDKVMLNLLSNAVRYTPTGRILVGCRRRGAKVEVWLCDTGIGFTPDDAESAFSLFTRGRHVAGISTEGLGLGLANVRQSLRLLGGDVRIHATSARGSILAFTLARAP